MRKEQREKEIQDNSNNIVRVCVHCESPKHGDDECPMLKLQQLQT